MPRPHRVVMQGACARTLAVGSFGVPRLVKSQLSRGYNTSLLEGACVTIGEAREIGLWKSLLAQLGSPFGVVLSGRIGAPRP